MWKLIREVLKKKKIAGGRASDKGQRSWPIIAVSHSHIPPWATGRLWEMVSNVHPGVIPPRGKGPAIFIQQLLHLGWLQEKNCQAKPYKRQQLELWQRTPKRRRPQEATRGAVFSCWHCTEIYAGAVYDSIMKLVQDRNLADCCSQKGKNTVGIVFHCVFISHWR